MNNRGAAIGRQDNTEKIKSYIRDSENTMTYSPQDHHGNKFFGSWNKLLNMQNMLLYENKEKYLNEYQMRFTAKLQVGSVPKCFDACVSDVETPGLSSDEKNCMRECYLKRVSSKDDLNMLFEQKLALDQLKGLRDGSV
jgi:hypothetical protein